MAQLKVRVGLERESAKKRLKIKWLKMKHSYIAHAMFATETVALQS